jgi:hypothetical protein
MYCICKKSSGQFYAMWILERKQVYYAIRLKVEFEECSCLEQEFGETPTWQSPPAG